MQPFSPLAEKTTTAPRPDAANHARSPGAGKSDPDATPFGAVFHGSPSRSGASEAGARAPAQTDQATGRTGPETSEGEDAKPAEDMSFDERATLPYDPETAVKPAEAGNAAPGRLPEQVSTRAQAGNGLDATDPGAAIPVTDRATSTEAETSGRSLDRKTTNHAIEQIAPGAARQAGDIAGSQIPLAADERPVAGPDRPPAANAAQPPVPSAPGAERSAGAGQTAPPWFVPEGAVAQTGRRDASGTDARPIRGQDDARLAAPIPASGPANTAPPPLMPGRAAETMPDTIISALHGDGSTGDAIERRRESDGIFGLEHRGASANGATVTSLAPPARAEMAQSAAMQIAAAIQKGGPGVKPGIELTLTPQELGRVRLTFNQSETGMIVNVQADRAETLELLRRNIDTLAQEFLDIGYESAQFTFDRDDGGAPTADPAGAMDGADNGPHSAQDTPRPAAPLVLPSDRLDIRL
ncbi:flagellar hook-length control protein FliK [Roseovarius sp. D22-M7]|uniref:flagellar hook-length control protein FliK n=1 Tax=Roseovarius sp. D22-M7 TaxID=3127116 RepID=UPI0030104D10